MENVHVAAAAAGHGEEQSFDRKAIWKTFRILLYITLFELALAIGYYKIEFQNRELVKHLLNGVFIILTLTKAFYIIAEFMHLRHEIRNMILTIAIPAMLFIWFIAAFLWEGNSYKNLRNDYDKYHKEGQPAPKNTEEKPESQKPGHLQ